MIKYIKKKIREHKEKKLMESYSKVKTLLTYEEFFELYNEIK